MVFGFPVPQPAMQADIQIDNIVAIFLIFNAPLIMPFFRNKITGFPKRDSSRLGNPLTA